MFTRKVEKFWDDNKAVICFVGGTCLVIAGSRYLKHMKQLNKLNHLVKDGSVSIMRKVIDPMFPDDMPISEIKAALDKIDGAQYQDALVSLVNGKKTLYIR